MNFHKVVIHISMHNQIRLTNTLVKTTFMNSKKHITYALSFRMYVYRYMSNIFGTSHPGAQLKKHILKH